MTLRLGVDVGGTNTDAVLIDDRDDVLASAKRPTTQDVHTGIVNVLRAVLDGTDPSRVTLAMLGTTQCTNAIVQRRDLRRVGVLRIGAPATTAIPPLADWPRDLTDAVLADSRVIAGGFHFDGRPIAPLDRDAVRRAAADWNGVVDAVAVSCVFSPTSASDELVTRELLRERLDVPISLSHQIGSVGLLERENAAVMNAALTGVARQATSSFLTSLRECGVWCGAYFSQNNGTLMSLDRAAEYPVLTVASGPTNSLRGAALLSGCRDGIVVDVGGTTTDFGALVNGFPRESGVAIEVGGVRTNFRMPDLVSIALGGGTMVYRDDTRLTIGPESVGHDITTRALCFGGDTVTLTDIAVASGHTMTGAGLTPVSLPDELTHAVRQRARTMIESALDRMRTSRRPVTVIAVGGGSFLIPDRLAGAIEVLRPPHHAVANAVGAAVAEMSGEVDRIFADDHRSRAAVRDAARAEARANAVEAGALASTVRDVDLEEVQLAYLPGDAVRIRARAVGSLDIDRASAVLRDRRASGSSARLP